MIAKLTKLRCPRCSKALGIPRKLAGKTFPCPKCGATFLIAEDLTHLRPLIASPEAEPVVAEVVDPPLAMSVEKPESAKFFWLIVIMSGVCMLLTLIVIAGVVLSLSAASPEAATPTKSHVTTEPTATDEQKASEPAEVFYDRTVAEPIEAAPNAAAQPQPDADLNAEPSKDE